MTFSLRSKGWNVMAALVLSTVGAVAALAQQAPVTLLHNITIPGIEGDFDFLTVDLKRGHLFAAAEDHHSIEMFDVKDGRASAEHSGSEDAARDGVRRGPG